MLLRWLQKKNLIVHDEKIGEGRARYRKKYNYYRTENGNEWVCCVAEVEVGKFTGIGQNKINYK